MYLLFFTAENAGLDDPDLFEGDMILTPDQLMAAKMGMDVDNPFGRGSTKNRQWPGGVVAYVIDSSLCKFIVSLYWQGLGIRLVRSQIYILVLTFRMKFLGYFQHLKLLKLSII